MGLRHVNEFADALPYALREQVVGYARSVQDAAPEILKEAKLPERAELVDRLVLLAGVRKLHALCASSFWVLDNATHLLARDDQANIRVGGTDYSRGADLHNALSVMLTELAGELASNGISEGMLQMPYPDLARLLADELTGT